MLCCVFIVQIFHLYITIGSIVFLCYVQFYILRQPHDHGHHDKASPFNLVATLKSGEDGVLTLHGGGNQESPPAPRSTVNVLQTPTFYLDDNETNLNGSNVLRQQNGPVAGRVNRISSTSSSRFSDEEDTWIDLSTIGSVFDHEGSSLFLRFGTLCKKTVRFTHLYTHICLMI